MLRFTSQRLAGSGRTAAAVLACLFCLTGARADGIGSLPPAETASPREMDDAALERLLELHYTEEEDVRLVLVPAVVTNRRGRVVRSLGARDFRLSEDHVPQEIRYFDTEAGQPISVAFLLDLSGSMRQKGKLDEAKQAIRIFVDSLQPGDRFGLIAFADEQVAWITEFTDDRERFLRRLAVQEAYGQTALFDAVAATPGLVDRESDGRKAIVLITDGADNASHLNTLQAAEVARRVRVPIYTLGFASLPDGVRLKGSTEPSLRAVRQLSDETGGMLLTMHDSADLKEGALRILSELRFRYIIGYHPTRKRWDGTFRRVKLEPARAGLTIHTRTGYYALP